MDVGDGFGVGFEEFLHHRDERRFVDSLDLQLCQYGGDVATFGADDDGMPIPARGGAQIVGALKVLEMLPGGDGLEVMIGDTWVSRVELRPGEPPLADSLLVYGNTTEPTAPRSKSQYGLWAEDLLRPRT